MIINSNQFVADYQFRIIDVQHFTKEQMDRLLADLLKDHSKYLAEHNSFCIKHFQKNNINISNCKNIEDLAIIPPTCNEDLIQCNNDFFTAPEDEIIDICLTCRRFLSAIQIKWDMLFQK